MEQDEGEGASGVVELNVGGKHYATLRETLMRHDSMLAAMFSGRQPLRRTPDGRVFIDRDGKLFRHILQYLRDGYLDVEALDKDLREQLRREASYFCLTELEERLTAAAPERSDGSDDPDCVLLMVELYMGTWFTVRGRHAKSIPAADRDRITATDDLNAASKLAGIYSQAGYRLTSVTQMATGKKHPSTGLAVLFHKV